MQNRVAIVTGAASGIGNAIAVKLSQQGCQVVVVDMNRQQGQETAGQIDGCYVEADLSRREDCRRVVDETLGIKKRIDILINNAGFQHIETIDAFPEDAWEKMLAVMLTAPFLLTKYAWPSMKTNRWGRIVNISSILGKVGAPFKAGYVSVKHGIIGLTRTTALEGGEFGITANAICPSFTRTPLVENQIADQARTRQIDPDEVESKVMLERAAIKRLIEPDEIAQSVAYLCGDAASAVTGIALPIDVGWTAG